MPSSIGWKLSYCQRVPGGTSALHAKHELSQVWVIVAARVVAERVTADAVAAIAQAGGHRHQVTNGDRPEARLIREFWQIASDRVVGAVDLAFADRNADQSRAKGLGDRERALG